MDVSPPPETEAVRLTALAALDVLDWPSDPALERLTTLASELFEVPTALVSLVDRQRLWFPASRGASCQELPREGSFCNHVIAGGKTLVVEDTLEDPRFVGCPSVSPPSETRFYAGVPLRPDGASAVGTLCVLDSRPRAFSSRDRHLLEQLAAQAEVLLSQQALQRRERQQQRELALSTRRMTAVLEESAAGIVRIDRSGIMRDINPFALRLLGYQRHELVGENVKVLMPAGEARQHDGFLGRYLAGGAPRIIGQGREVVARHREGQRVPVHLAVSAIRGDDGEVDEFIGILTDLSEIHEARRAALRERTLLGAIIDGSREPIYARSSSGRYLAANHACLALLDLAREQELPPLSTLLPEPLAERIEAAEREVIRLGHPRQLLLGEVKGRHLELSLSPLGSPEEGVRGVVGVVHDTTEARRQSNLLRVLHQGITDYQALMSGQQLWEFLMEALRELTDSDYALIGEVVEANGEPGLKVHAITDLSWSEESRQLMEQLRSGDMMLTNPDGLLGRVFAHGQVVMTDDLASHPGRSGFPPGHPSIRNYLGVPIHDGQTIIGMFAIANGRRHYDQALLEWLSPFTSTCALLINLHRGLAERARATEALAEARDQAESASRAKSEFLSSMSHELRTPLNAVLGYAQLLANSRQQPLNERQARQVAQIERSGQHLLALINDILDLARIEAGKLSLSLEAVRLEALIGDALMSVETSAADAGITLVAPDAVDLPPVRADYTRLKQVLLNLLSNAIKYNRRGGRVEVGVTRERERVCLSVRDTGYGIAVEHEGAIFDPFQRLGAEHGTVEGTGIGLSITRQLVEAMDGEIRVDSQLGVGSDFQVVLPRVRDPQVWEPEEGEEGEAPSAMPPVSASRVLYVEDNPANRQLMRDFFEELNGVQLRSVDSAEAALDALRRRVPDLLLLDIHLPGMDGHALLKCLRKNPQLGALPVVAVTASAMPNDLRRGALSGFDDYLTKPLDLERLRQVLDTWLVTQGGRHV
ncbi:GAF domain-containing protein [Halomonas salifodinae]|uniref:GAF domain-containing protein n=1 Tax=Halomonas salifodinae TaxID=438745 RepID=UPI0033A46DA8